MIGPTEFQSARHDKDINQYHVIKQACVIHQIS